MGNSGWRLHAQVCGHEQRKKPDRMMGASSCRPPGPMSFVQHVYCTSASFDEWKIFNNLKNKINMLKFSLD